MRRGPGGAGPHFPNLESPMTITAEMLYSRYVMAQLDVQNKTIPEWDDLDLGEQEVWECLAASLSSG
jgi:hypothetical protein